MTRRSFIFGALASAAFGVKAAAQPCDRWKDVQLASPCQTPREQQLLRLHLDAMKSWNKIAGNWQYTPVEMDYSTGVFTAIKVKT